MPVSNPTQSDPARNQLIRLIVAFLLGTMAATLVFLFLQRSSTVPDTHSRRSGPSAKVGLPDQRTEPRDLARSQGQRARSADAVPDSSGESTEAVNDRGEPAKANGLAAEPLASATAVVGDGT